MGRGKNLYESEISFYCWILLATELHLVSGACGWIRNYFLQDFFMKPELSLRDISVQAVDSLQAAERYPASS